MEQHFNYSGIKITLRVRARPLNFCRSKCPIVILALPSSDFDTRGIKMLFPSFRAKIGSGDTFFDRFGPELLVARIRSTQAEWSE